MKFTSKISFRMKLILLVVVAIISIGSVSIFQLTKLKHTIETDGLKSFQSYAEGLSGSIQAQFFERYGDIQAFASNGILRNNDPERISEALNTYITLYGIYDIIIMTDLDGNLIASSTVDPSGKKLNLSMRPSNYSQSNWFKNVIANKFTEDKAKGFVGTYVEDVHVDKITSIIYNKKMYGNSFSSFVTDSNGENIGVLSARAGWRWVEHDFKDWYSRLKSIGLDSSELTMLNHKGEVIIDYDPTVSGSLELDRNFEEVLLKLNLVAKGVKTAVLSTKGEIGADYSVHARKGLEQIAGYASIKGGKFTDSLGWSVLVRADKDQFLSSMIKAERTFYLIFSILLIIVLIIAVWFSKKISDSLQGVADHLSKVAGELNGASGSIGEQSDKLASSTDQQAAGLQETVASINEISAMVRKNSESAQSSKKTSLQSKQSANLGKETVQRMIGAISEISKSNQSIKTQMEQVSTEFTRVVSLIQEIGTKTEVINDIVFQTKLLSFNASVEAARAGENGKGFSVVAEEVGNLAHMSGTAASEISSMLGNSIDQVQKIVKNTQDEVSVLINEAQDKVNYGIKTAEECGDSINSIDSNVGSVNNEIDGIANASQEQSQGVDEINKAITEFGDITSNNKTIAQESSVAAKELSQQSGTLAHLVKELLEIVNGEGHD